MLSSVTSAPVVTNVTLQLSPLEFYGLYYLHNRYGGGDPDYVRGDIEHGLQEAMDKIPQDLLKENMRCTMKGADLATWQSEQQSERPYIYDQVQEVWDACIG